METTYNTPTAQSIQQQVTELIKSKGHNLKSNLAAQGNTVATNYIAELFKGNGWITAIHQGRSGKAILLSAPKQPDAVLLIVKIVLDPHKLSYTQVKQHLLDFENNLGPLYSCVQFCLIALNGCEAKAEKLEDFNLLLQDHEYINELIQHYSTTKIQEPRIQLFAHNKQTYNKVKKLMATTKSVAVVQATGTGKSYLISRLLQDFAGQPRLVMAPSHYIIDQLKEHILWDKNILYMTYARSMNLSQTEIAALQPRLIVMDEYHRCGADEWGRGVNNILNAYPNAFKFGTSATPVRYMDNGRDMSLELFNGNVAENLNIAQAIVRNILPMPKYVCALYTIAEETSNLKARIASSNKSDVHKNRLLLHLDAFNIDWEQSMGIAKVLKKHLAKHMRKFIVFCKDEAHLLEMQPVVKKWFKESNPGIQIKQYCVYDNEPNSASELDQFKFNSEKECIHLLFSINMLNEGVHVTDVHGVILLRPTESPTIFYQQIGRCLKVGLNHQPVIFDFVNNFKSIRTHDFLYDLGFERSSYKSVREKEQLPDRCPKFSIHDEVRNITDVFGEIKFQLDLWDEFYDQLVLFKKRQGHCEVSKQDKDDERLYRWLLQQQKQYYYGRMPADRLKLLNELGVKWKKQIRLPVDEQWEIHFQKLCTYRETNGHTNVPKTENTRLNDFVRLQRARFKTGSLEQYRIQKLNSIGFEWERKTYIEGIWQQRFDQLSTHNNKYGNCNVSAKQNQQLFMWVMKQRSDFKNGKLDRVRKQKLDTIGFEWQRQLPDDILFAKKLLEMKQFVSANGHFNFRSGSSLEYYFLKIRKQYANGQLSNDKVQQLQAIDFPFTKRNAAEEVAMIRIEKLLPFFKKHGHCNIPEKDNSGQYAWLLQQRKNYNKGQLSNNVALRLNELNIDWNISKNAFARKWEAKYNSLKNYFQQNGNILVSSRNKTNTSLKDWIIRQRRDFKKGKLNEEQINKLKKINFAFEIDDTWDQRFQELVQYKNTFGNCNVPQKKGIYKILSNWCGNVRQRYKNKTLPPEKALQLETLGFKWDLEEYMWQTGYNDLKLFLEKNTWSDMPRKNPKVFNFCNTQRYAKRKNLLQEERIMLLNKLGLDWNPIANKWDNMYDQLHEYFNKNNSLTISATDKKSETLRKWCYTQRSNFRKNILASEQIEKLNNLNFVWSVQKSTQNKLSHLAKSK